jgi:lysophospholipase L1-like esterase
MRRKWFQLVTAGLAVGGMVVLSATAAGSSQPLYQPPRAYYLALGDSMAYGYQPTKAKAGARAADFDTGYVDVFAKRLRRISPGLRVVNYGCPGESTVTFTRGGCPTLAEGVELHDPHRGSQLQAARSFLRAHRGQVSPITVTLWGGDLFPLSEKGKRARAAISAFGSRFTTILEQLRAAAPNAEIIVTGAWNLEADRFARVDPLYRSVDAAIRRAASASRARVADMFAALNGPGNVESRRARLCSLTFTCSKHDPHPTDAGYRAMAKALLIASGYPGKIDGYAGVSLRP